MATFITSKSVGQDIEINVQSSTGYWKYNHNGSDSSVFSNGSQTITVTNANGEFTLIPCLSDGTVSGNIIILYLYNNQITSFDGTDLTSLTTLGLGGNQLTSFDGTGLSSLTSLDLGTNQLTSFDGTGLTSLSGLFLNDNQLTSLSGFTFPVGLNVLGLNDNQLTSFDGTGLTSLTQLNLGDNQLTSFDGTDLSGLVGLTLTNNLLTSLDVSPMVSLTHLYLVDSYGKLTNPMTAASNNSILYQLDNNGVENGNFVTINGRTSAGTADYDALIAKGWNLLGLDLTAAPPSNPTFITSKAVGQNVTVRIQTNSGYWKSNHNGVDSPVYNSGLNIGSSRNLQVTNSNGEFTIIPCDASGNPTGAIEIMRLGSAGITNQITLFDGTGLTSLTSLTLDYNQLTSFDGTGLSSLTYLALRNNLLTSFDGTGLSSLTSLGLGNNQLTSFNGTDLSSITGLNLNNNQLTSLDITGLTSLTQLYLDDNLLTPSSNNQILNLLDQYGLENGEFNTTGGRTSAGTADYDALVAKGWTLSGLDLTFPVTFITSKSVGQDITINVETSTGYWKYNHNGSDSSVFDQNNGSQTITVANANGEFTIIPCLSDGTINGNIFHLNLDNNQLTSFDGTGLTSLAYLDCNNNQLTSFDGTGLSSLTALYLGENQLTSFDGTGLTSLTSLYLSNNPLTSFNGGDMGQMSSLNLINLQLTSFDGTGLTSLTDLNLGNNQLASFDGTGLSSLIGLYLSNNQLTSFDGTGLTSLTTLNLIDNQLTSLDVSPMTSLQTLYLADAYGTLTNPMTAASNNSILSQLDNNGVENGEFYTINGRTSAGTADYDALIAKGWNLLGLDLMETTTTTTTEAPPSGNGKLRIKGVNSGGGTTTTTTSGPTFTFFNRNSSGGISNTLIEVYEINEKIGTVIMIDSGLTDTNGYFYSYVAVGGKFEYAFKCYDTTDNLGNLTWGGIAMVGNTHARPLTRNVYYNITVYSTFDSNPVQNLPINLTEYFGSGALNDILDISPNNRGLIGTTDENGNITGNIMADFQLHFGSDEFTDGNGVLYRSEELVFIPQNQNSYDGGANLQPKYATWNLLGVPGTNNLNVLDQIDNDGNFITNILSTTSEGFATPMLIDGVNYKLSVYDGTDNPPTTEPIYTETWTAVWGVDHVTDLSTTTTTTTEAPTTTTTTTEAPSYTIKTIKPVGESFGIQNIVTSTGYWLYSHDGTNSAPYEGNATSITVTNANGEFTFISCLSDGTPSGNIIELGFANGSLITDFNGLGLSDLTYLNLFGEKLTSFDGVGLTSLTTLGLNSNEELTSITNLPLTLVSLSLVGSPITSIDISGMNSLTSLYLADAYGTNALVTSTNNSSILAQLDSSNISDGTFITSNGRTSAGNTSYDNLINKGWNIMGAEEEISLLFDLTVDNGIPNQLVVLITASSGGPAKGPGGPGAKGPGGPGGGITEYASIVTDENGIAVFSGITGSTTMWAVQVYNTPVKEGMVVWMSEFEANNSTTSVTQTRTFYDVNFLNQDDNGVISNSSVDIYLVDGGKQANSDGDNIYPIFMFSGTTDVNGNITTNLSSGSYIIRTFDENGDLTWGQYFDVFDDVVSISRPLSEDVEINISGLITTTYTNMWTVNNNAPVEGMDVYYYDGSKQVYSFDPLSPIGQSTIVNPTLTLLGQTDSTGGFTTNGTPVSISSGVIGVTFGNTDNEGKLYDVVSNEYNTIELGTNINGTKVVEWTDQNLSIQYSEWHPQAPTGKHIRISVVQNANWVAIDSFNSVEGVNTYFSRLAGGTEYKLDMYNDLTVIADGSNIGYTEYWTPNWNDSKTTIWDGVPN